MNVYIKKPFNVVQGKPNFVWQKALVWTLVLATGIIFLNLFQAQARNSFFYASSPISNILLQAGKTSAHFSSSFLNFSLLKRENGALKTENQNLLASLSQLKENVQAGQELKTALGNTKSDAFTLLQARVIGFDIQNDSMLIDRGSNHNIFENMPVISKEKVLFGKIAKVYPDFSQVMLISAKKSTLGVKIQSLDGVANPIFGAVKGSGSLSAYLDLISADSEIKPGDVLITSAQDGIFPKDLLVGKISSATANDSGAFQTAAVQPFLSPQTTDNVLIITNYLKQ